MENIFKLMEKYNLTLRRLSDEETLCYSPIPNRELRDNETLVETITRSNVSKEEFEKRQKKGYWQSCRFNNGFVIGKAVREVKKRKGGWLVKQDNSHGSIQYWDRKFDYYGNTPEEAINKAIEDIEKRLVTDKENKKKAGIC